MSLGLFPIVVLREKEWSFNLRQGCLLSYILRGNQRLECRKWKALNGGRKVLTSFLIGIVIILIKNLKFLYTTFRPAFTALVLVAQQSMRTRRACWSPTETTTSGGRPLQRVSIVLCVVFLSRTGNDDNIEFSVMILKSHVLIGYSLNCEVKLFIFLLMIGWHKLGSKRTSLSQFRWNDRTIRYTNISSQMVSWQSVLCKNRMDGPIECNCW